MPNLWTHIIFSDLVAEKAGLDISKYKNIFHLGAQGPDPFFYHNFYSLKRNNSYAYIGGIIHRQKCGEYLIGMLKYSKKQDSDLLKIYSYGFLTHHLLDRSTHPYIIYKSGEDGHKHQVLETTIDTIIAKDIKNIETWKTPVHKKIYVGKVLPEEINNLTAFLLENVHKLNYSNLKQIINKSYTDLIKALKILYDPTGIKHAIFRGYIVPFSHRRKYPTMDYLNLNKETWSHPIDETETSNETFYEIFYKAVDEGSKLFQLVEAYYDGEDDLSEIENEIGNISYESGKECDVEYELKYFNPIV